jgi:putative hydrolase of the HAD superfamily
VLNSYHLGKSKKDASVFDDVAKALGLLPEEILFIDDNESHVNRALSKGLAAIVYRGKSQLIEHLKAMSLLS